MKFYSILEGSQTDINRRLLRLIKKQDNTEALAILTSMVNELVETTLALDERIKALEGEGEGE